MLFSYNSKNVAVKDEVDTVKFSYFRFVACCEIFKAPFLAVMIL